MDLKPNVEIYNITIPKIDYMIIKMSLKENEELVELDENADIVFSVSKSPDTTDYIFQKSLGNGITYDSENKKYLIEIESNDTKNLPLNKTYGYDITIYYTDDKPKQKAIGTFTVSDKFTMSKVVQNNG